MCWIPVCSHGACDTEHDTYMTVMAGLRVLQGHSLPLPPEGRHTGPTGPDGQPSNCVFVGFVAQKAESVSLLVWFFYQFPRTAIAKYHELGGLIQENYIYIYKSLTPRSLQGLNEILCVKHTAWCLAHPRWDFSLLSSYTYRPHSSSTQSWHCGFDSTVWRVSEWQAIRSRPDWLGALSKSTVPTQGW